MNLTSPTDENDAIVGYVVSAGCADLEETPHSSLCGTFKVEVECSATCGPSGMATVVTLAKETCDGPAETTERKPTKSRLT